MQNLKKKQNRNGLIDVENKLLVAIGEGGRRWVKNMKGIKGYKLPGTK